MGLACKITGRKWHKTPDGGEGCSCARCGERNWGGDHDWRKQPGSCVAICAWCGREDTRHGWNRCTCPWCGEVRDSCHEWGAAKPSVPFAHAGHYRPCTICGKCQDKPHSIERVKSRKCYYRCTACGYGAEWHEFQDGACVDCGIDESKHYCNQILSGKVWGFDDWEYSPLDGSRIRYIDHVKSVADLRRLALSDRKGIGDYHRVGFARRIGEIAEAGGPDAHEANLALCDIVLNASLGWSMSSVADLITEPEIASDPKIVEKLRQVEESRYAFERAMVDADNGL